MWIFPAVVLAAVVSHAPTTVHIKDFRYNPDTVKVYVGEPVTFINDDSEAHTVTSTDKTFDSEGLDTGNTWRHVFTKAGAYTYFCELHPYMKAVIIVMPAQTNVPRSKEKGSK